VITITPSSRAAIAEQETIAAALRKARFDRPVGQKSHDDHSPVGCGNSW